MTVTNMSTICSNRTITGTFKSRWIDVRNAWAVHLEVKLGGTGSGAFTIEESNDPAIDQENRSTDGDSSAASAAAGVNITSDTARVTYSGVTPPPSAVTAPGQFIAHVNQPGRYLRLVCVATGSPTLTLWAVGKD